MSLYRTPRFALPAIASQGLVALAWLFIIAALCGVFTRD
jgi:hypothetical protein